jgi:dTDP-4-amino-4,6-dideoxygalactose transaminase
MDTFIPLIIPDVEFDDIEADFRQILKTGILSSGPYVGKFEKSIANRVGVDHAVATTSATSALHLALMAVGVGPGDEVLVSDFTFPATANAVIQTGAAPVFVDSYADGFTMDPEHARMLVSERTRVIMPVDSFGQPADHKTLECLANEVGALLVVDAACSLGAARGGMECGAHGDMGCFSFHPRKVITCGEGGMVTTNDSSLATRLRLLRNHGSQKPKGDGRVLEFVEPGFNYRLSEMPAALGLEQMKRLDRIISDRQVTASRYDKALVDLPELWIPGPPTETTWSYQSYVVVLEDGIDREVVITGMADGGIETTIGTYACHQHPAFATWGRDREDLSNSARFADRSLTLPVIPRMSTSQVDRVVETLISVLECV